MVQVKFITNGANSAFGGFAAGDTLRCSEAMAAHLVTEIGCAKYVVAPEADKPDEQIAEAPKRGANRKNRGNV